MIGLRFSPIVLLSYQDLYSRISYGGLFFCLLQQLGEDYGGRKRKVRID